MSGQELDGRTVRVRPTWSALLSSWLIPGVIAGALAFGAVEFRAQANEKRIAKVEKETSDRAVGVADALGALAREQTETATKVGDLEGKVDSLRDTTTASDADLKRDIRELRGLVVQAIRDNGNHR